MATTSCGEPYIPGNFGIDDDCGHWDSMGWLDRQEVEIYGYYLDVSCKLCGEHVYSFDRAEGICENCEAELEYYDE